MVEGIQPYPPSHSPWDFLFVAITRTGTQSIKHNIRRSKIGRRPSKRTYHPDVPYAHPQHYSALDWRVVLGEEDFHRRFKFTFVRNPWSHLLSHYTNRCRVGVEGLRRSDAHHPEVFNKWVTTTLTTGRVEKCGITPRPNQPPCDHYRNIHWNCLDWITDDDGNIMVDFVGRYENLEEDWRKVRGVLEERTGLTMKRDQPLVHKHRSNIGHGYRWYYNDETKELVREHYKKDIEAFDYDF